MFCSSCGAKNAEGAKFCQSCGAAIAPITPTAPAPTTSTPTENAPMVASRKTPLGPAFYALGPIVFLIALVVIWGILNLFAGQNQPPAMEFFNNVLIPFLFALSFFAIPIGIIVAIVKHNTGYTGEIRCGNCHYVGQGRKGRSVWAQVVVWIVFFFFWPVTLVYYLVTHSYYCPSCNSSFVGLKNKQGVYTAPSTGASGALILVLVVVVFLVITILASVVLASLGKAREKAADASTTATLSNLLTEAKLYAATGDASYEGFCSHPETQRQLGNLPFVSETTPLCYDSNTGFAVTAETNAGTHFCIDAWENALEVNAPLKLNQTLCIQN